MKTIYRQIAIVIIGLGISQLTFAQGPTETVDTNIVGEWVSIKDNSIRVEYQDNGTCKVYNDNVLIDEYTYEISEEDCSGSDSAIAITYLKRIYSDGYESCGEVSVRNEHMSILSYPRGNITEYTRQ